MDCQSEKIAFIYCSGCSGLNTIVVMAFERFFVVCKPFGNVPFGHKASMAGKD